MHARHAQNCTVGSESMKCCVRQGCMAACKQVPGNIRRAEHFCAFLRRLVEHLKGRISVEAVVQESCTTFLATLQESINIDGAPSATPCSWNFFSTFIMFQIVNVCRATQEMRKGLDKGVCWHVQSHCGSFIPLLLC